ncbi:hypothetical protein F4779DRAFT_13766 [Xylariaceae sp. FL0662B]|nr:hypothetical protein F4779DRAFT_13766 [Xylariaceae sp. FL0662B]
MRAVIPITIASMVAGVLSSSELGSTAVAGNDIGLKYYYLPIFMVKIILIPSVTENRFLGKYIGGKTAGSPVASLIWPTVTGKFLAIMCTPET